MAETSKISNLYPREPGTSQASPNYQEPYQDDFILSDFTFTSGGSLPKLRIHYRTIGTLRRDNEGHAVNAVMIMHGTGGSGKQFLVDQFAGQLFVPGGLLDASRYFIILRDGIGHGDSSKPSDGLRAEFPRYGYEDMVRADYRLLTEGLGVDHLRLVMGTSSMSSTHNPVHIKRLLTPRPMHQWVECTPGFGVECIRTLVSISGQLSCLYGQFSALQENGSYHNYEFALRANTLLTLRLLVDALMPLASLPMQISGRNRMFRKMILDGIKKDPQWQGGKYIDQPYGLVAAVYVLTFMSSIPLQWQKAAPDKDSADAFLDRRIAAALDTMDANDLLYQVDASYDYDPRPSLGKIKAPLLAVNSADDQVNPPELGILENEIKHVSCGRAIVLPITDKTMGHGSHTYATLWKDLLASLLQESEMPQPKSIRRSWLQFLLFR